VRRFVAHFNSIGFAFNPLISGFSAWHFVVVRSAHQCLAGADLMALVAFSNVLHNS